MSVAIIGVPLDLGAGRRGVDMGPSAIRLAGLAERLRGLGVDVVDAGNVAATVAETTTHGDPHAHFLAEIMGTCGELAQLVAATVAEGRTPLVLGGDHSIAIGTLGDRSSTSPCCDRIPAGYAFATLPAINPITRSSWFMNDASAALMNSGS